MRYLYKPSPPHPQFKGTNTYRYMWWVPYRLLRAKVYRFAVLAFGIYFSLDWLYFAFSVLQC